MNKDKESKQDKTTANVAINLVAADSAKAKDESMNGKDKSKGEEQPVSDSEMTSEISFGDRDEQEF